MYSGNSLFNRISDAASEAIAQSQNFIHEILVILCVFVVMYFVTEEIRRRKSNFPPGPRGFPIVGYLPFLSRNMHLDFIEMAKKYGDVFSLRLGSVDVVVANGADAIKEAFAKNEFLGRPPEGALKVLNENSAFFANTVHLWREQRRFVVQSLKDLGLGKTRIEGEIMEEINLLMNFLRNQNNEPVNLEEPLSPSMSNNICALIFGKRLDYSNPERKLLDRMLNKGVESISLTALLTFLPWIGYIPFHSKFMKLGNTIDAFQVIAGVLRNEIKKHRDTFDPTNVRDFIDSYFIEMEARQKKEPNTTFCEDNLLANMLDLFAAGSETVRTSILWCVYCVAAFPEVQKRIQLEIQEVMGCREPDFQDMKLMPYTHAVIMEVLRWQPILPINVLRYAVEDATLTGYNVPAGTIVLFNFWAAHRDPRYWSDPDSFMPERFLSTDGKSVVKSSYYFAFSGGKRSCPGETMAYMEVFLYFTSMLQKFDIVFPEGMKPNFSAHVTVTYRLDPYKVRFIPRK